jgi:hypothetical protein
LKFNVGAHADLQKFNDWAYVSLRKNFEVNLGAHVSLRKDFAVNLGAHVSLRKDFAVNLGAHVSPEVTLERFTSIRAKLH